jgi:hypothetical protein
MFIAITAISFVVTPALLLLIKQTPPEFTQAKIWISES